MCERKLSGIELVLVVKVVFQKWRLGKCVCHIWKFSFESYFWKKTLWCVI